MLQYTYQIQNFQQAQIKSTAKTFNKTIFRPNTRVCKILHIYNIQKSILRTHESP